MYFYNLSFRIISIQDENRISRRKGRNFCALLYGLCPSGLRLLRDRFVRLHSDLLSWANKGVCCLGRIGSPSKSRRQKIHGMEYVEIRLDLSAESCAGSPIFNIGETMFWSVRIGMDHDARCRRALSRLGFRFYLSSLRELVTSPARIFLYMGITYGDYICDADRYDFSLPLSILLNSFIHGI